MKAAKNAAVGIIAIAAALAAMPAAAQDVNLTGRYQCVQVCASAVPGQFAYITQYGRRELNVVNEAGMGSRAWIDYPGRIWIERAEQGAVYSADGMTIQFDRGTVWQRVIDLPPPPPPLRRKG